MTVDPARASSVWLGMPCINGPKGAERLRELVPMLHAAQAQREERRARVLAHPWARARLCHIFGYKKAGNWNGYVPPRSDPAEDKGNQLARPNTSPQRAALVQLLRDVQHFEETGELPAAAVMDTEQLALVPSTGE